MVTPNTIRQNIDSYCIFHWFSAKVSHLFKSGLETNFSLTFHQRVSGTLITPGRRRINRVEKKGEKTNVAVVVAPANFRMKTVPFIPLVILGSRFCLCFIKRLAAARSEAPRLWRPPSKRAYTSARDGFVLNYYVDRCTCIGRICLSRICTTCMTSIRDSIYAEPATNTRK